MKTAFFLAGIFCVSGISGQAQDTLAPDNDWKHRVGIKIIMDNSNDFSLSPDLYITYSGGFQYLCRIRKSRSSVESGMYCISKVIKEQHIYTADGLFFLTIPFNYRLDTRFCYVVVGPYVDYLVHLYYSNSYSRTQDQNKYRKFNLGWDIALGVEKRVSGRLSSFMELRRFQTITSSIVRKGYDRFESSFRNIGVALGVNYKIPR